MQGEVVPLPVRPKAENITFEVCPSCGQARPRQMQEPEMPDQFAAMLGDPAFAREFAALLDQVAGR